jgi:phenylacetate-CoA oxygenase PaaI subunit
VSGFLDPGALDAEARAALRRLILTLADSKRLMGIRYSDWLLGAPSIETGIAASSMCQDEWGHARLLYAMLKDLGDDPRAAEHERADADYASVGPLDAPFPDWAAVIAGMALVDAGLTVALEAFAAGSFEPATTRAPKMIAEEEFHASLAAAWYRRLAGSTDDEARGLLAGATRTMLPAMLAWLGNDDDGARALVAAGVTAPGDTLTARYRDRVRALASLVDVDVDAVEPAPGLDAVRGRGAGHPDAEACERARGDRNRTLFVE